MNEPTVMYTVKPIIRFSEDIDLPKCMYAMRNIQKSLAVCETRISEKTMPPTVSEQCRLPEVCVLESRQEAILEQLSQLKKQMAALRQELGRSVPASRARRTTSVSATMQSGAIHDVVINASPEHPPFSILALYRLWGEMLKLRICSHIHSTVAHLPAHLSSFQPSTSSGSKTAPLLNITIIWKDVGADTELVISPLKHVGVRGEVNALRYLMRLGPPQYNYELTDDPAMATALDRVMDACYQVVRIGSSSEQQLFLGLLDARLGGSMFLLDRSSISMADVAAWSVLRQLGCQHLSQGVATWFQRCSSTLKLGT